MPTRGKQPSKQTQQKLKALGMQLEAPPTPPTPHTRLTSTFGLSADNLLVTPVIGGPGQYLRYRKRAWPGPSLLAFPRCIVDMGSNNYYGAQQITFGAPTLVLP